MRFRDLLGGRALLLGIGWNRFIGHGFPATILNGRRALANWSRDIRAGHRRRFYDSALSFELPRLLQWPGRVPSASFNFESSQTRRKRDQRSVPKTSLYFTKPRKWMNLLPALSASMSDSSSPSRG